MTYLIAFLILFTVFSCQKNTYKADKIVLNTVIWTGNQEQPNAQVMAFVGDSILAMGTNEEIEKLKIATNEIIISTRKMG